MRFAIQIGGEIRNWETSSVLFREYRSALRNLGVEVDFYLVGWNSDYSRECDKNGLFDFCQEYRLIDIPQEAIQPAFTAKFKNNDTGRSISLYAWSYALYLSYFLRKKYQVKHSIRYDLVWFTRPDVYVPYEHWRSIVEELKWHKEVESAKAERSDFTLYSFRPVRGVVKGHSILHHFSDDIKMCGDEAAMDIFSHSFHLHYLSQDPGFIGTYHSIPYLSAMKYGLGFRNDTYTSKKWMILRRNDGVGVMGRGDEVDVYIDKRYLDSGLMESVLKGRILTASEVGKKK